MKKYRKIKSCMNPRNVAILELGVTTYPIASDCQVTAINPPSIISAIIPTAMER